jgi:DNA-binding transcriptional LysR family regulator
MDKLISMRAFTKVVARGSYSEAAREMRLSRPAVSKYIIDLEEDLGVQLLTRTPRSASPTGTNRIRIRPWTIPGIATLRTTGLKI